MSALTKVLAASTVLLLAANCYNAERLSSAKKEVSRMSENTDALMQRVVALQKDSVTSGVKVKTLHLTLDEYKKYRSEDAKKIKELGVKLKDLEETMIHQMDISAEFEAMVVRDTLFVLRQIVRLDTPHLSVSGVIEDGKMKGAVKFPPVHIQQAVFPEYKHKFLWWRWGIDGFSQIITTDNPHVKIVYSEYIKIKK